MFVINNKFSNLIQILHFQMFTFFRFFFPQNIRFLLCLSVFVIWFVCFIFKLIILTFDFVWFSIFFALFFVLCFVLFDLFCLIFCLVYFLFCRVFSSVYLILRFVFCFVFLLILPNLFNLTCLIFCFDSFESFSFVWKIL